MREWASWATVPRGPFPHSKVSIKHIDESWDGNREPEDTSFGSGTQTNT